MEFFLTILGTVLVLASIVFILKKPIVGFLASYFKVVFDENFRLVEEKTKSIFKEERERLLEQYKSKEQLLEERLKKGEQFIELKEDTIRELVLKINEELRRHQKKLEEVEKERITEFNTLKNVIEEHKLVTDKLHITTRDLKNILSNNQLRGKYGEEVAENLLKSVGFVKGQNYVVNEMQDTVSTRPDFTILLPDKTKINVDAKFPLQALIKFQETDDKREQDRYIKDFAQDVRQKIKEITTRDYINPEEKTVDFVIMFVPNEMIFSFIYDKLPDVWNEAIKKKVILAGPFSFTAILRMVYQSYKNFKYQENLYEIIKLIKAFELEYTKFSQELDKLGDRLSSTVNQYEVVSLTRTKKLTGIVEKIRGEEILPAPERRQDDK